MKYMRKTPVEAIQWTGDNRNEVQEFISHTTKYHCTWYDGSGNLIISYKYIKGRKFNVVVPKFGWVVRDGMTFQFYKDTTFRKTFEEVREDSNNGIGMSDMDKLTKKAFPLENFDNDIKLFNAVFGAEPSKDTLDAIRTRAHINPGGRPTNLIDNLYRYDEKTREEIKKQLSEGLKEMAGNEEKENPNDKTKGTEFDTFESVLDEMKELHAKKDKDYSGSFHNLFKEYGISYALGHIEEKLNRVKAIIANGGNAVKNEHIEDSLIDGACYNILTLIELRNGKH